MGCYKYGSEESTLRGNYTGNKSALEREREREREPGHDVKWLTCMVSASMVHRLFEQAMEQVAEF